MLIIHVKPGEKIIVGTATLQINQDNRGRGVQVMIDAPKDVPVLFGKRLEEANQKKASA